MTCQRRLQPRPLSKMAGLSLIELMISITIGLIILTAVALVFVNASTSRAEIERVSRQIENGRYAIDLLSDDLRLAGFYGEISVSSLSAAGTPAVPNPPAALPDPCSLTPSVWNAAIPIHIQGFNNNASDAYYAASAPACLPAGLNFQPGTDILVVRRARTCFAGVGGCEAETANKAYLQVSLCQYETTTHALDVQGAAGFTLHKKNCTQGPPVGGTAADKRQYYVHIYYVGTDNGAGVSVPTLKRLSLEVDPADNTLKMYGESLVEGIEQFNVDYGVDTDGDGAPDSYMADPNNHPACNDACKVGNWMNVVTAKVHVVARNLEATPGYNDAKTYELGSVSYTPATADRVYRRHAYTALVRINNPANRRDTP
jgi:type IV pilus assembly protein PilW